MRYTFVNLMFFYTDIGQYLNNSRGLKRFAGVINVYHETD